MESMETTITTSFAPEDLNHNRKFSRCRSEVVEPFFDRKRKGDFRSKKNNNVPKNIEGITDYCKTVINSLDEEKMIKLERCSFNKQYA